MGPLSSSQHEKIVRKNYKVQGLKDQESVPSLNHKRLVVEYDHTQNHLGYKNTYSGTNCNPLEDVHGPHKVTLRDY